MLVVQIMFLALRAERKRFKIQHKYTLRTGRRGNKGKKNSPNFLGHDEGVQELEYDKGWETWLHLPFLPHAFCVTLNETIFFGKWE